VYDGTIQVTKGHLSCEKLVRLYGDFWGLDEDDYDLDWDGVEEWARAAGWVNFNGSWANLSLLTKGI
jgi:hypothetical protein